MAPVCHRPRRAPAGQPGGGGRQHRDLPQAGRLPPRQAGQRRPAPARYDAALGPRRVGRTPKTTSRPVWTSPSASRAASTTCWPTSWSTPSGPGPRRRFPSAATQAARIKGAERGTSHRERLRPGRLGAERALTVAGEILDECRYEPQRETPTQLRLRNCPFHPLSARAPDVVCAVNQAYLNGLLEGLGATSAEAVPDPSRARAASGSPVRCADRAPCVGRDRPSRSPPGARRRRRRRGVLQRQPGRCGAGEVVVDADHPPAPGGEHGRRQHGAVAALAVHPHLAGRQFGDLAEQLVQRMCTAPAMWPSSHSSRRRTSSMTGRPSPAPWRRPDLRTGQPYRGDATLPGPGPRAARWPQRRSRSIPILASSRWACAICSGESPSSVSGVPRGSASPGTWQSADPAGC